MFALVDANNMYVSCERVFQPRLVGRPVVVLSSNDGACIARSNEAKELGVKMAQPWFQVRHLARSAGLIAVSANFELYNDLSARMMAIIARYAHEQLVYSIDESFLSFPGAGGDLAATGRELRAQVLRETGLPTSVGFGPTMTLAKLANHVAKTADRKPGSYPAPLAQVCHLGQLTAAELRGIFAATAVRDIWGIGRQIASGLEQAGVRSVLELVDTDAATLRRRYSVVLEKTLRELRGTACLRMDGQRAAKQQILVSRSFGRRITECAGLEEAISEFASRAAEKLRQQGSVAAAITVFFMTSPHRRDEAQHAVERVMPLVRPSADTATLAAAALAGVRAEFRSGFAYARAGVVVVDLSPAGLRQGELALAHPADPLRPATDPDRARLMATIDHLNRRYGRNAVHIGSVRTPRAGGTSTWATRQDLRSPRYTTRWEEMPLVRA